MKSAIGAGISPRSAFDEIDQHQVVRWSSCIDAFFVLDAFLLRRDAHRKLRLRFTKWFSIGCQRAQVLARPSLALSFDGAGAPDLLLQQQYAVEQRLRRRRATGHVDVDWDDT